MQYVIGIDGGGTKTILRACSLDDEILAEVSGGPSNLHTASADEVSKMLWGMLDSALSSKGLKIDECMYLCMGAAGVDRENERELLEKMFESYGITCPIYIANDAEAMLAAGAGEPVGVVVIAGTGSIAYGKDRKGNACRSGGWGHLIGDEGSGYWIAKEAINVAVRFFDKRNENTLLLDMLMTKLCLNSPWDFIEFVYSSGKGKKEIAALAAIVDEAGRAGDEAARRILADAAKELYITCNAVIVQLDFENEDFNVVIGGSVLLNNKFVYDAFCTLLRNEHPKAGIITPSQSAAAGAARIALHMLAQKNIKQ